PLGQTVPTNYNLPALLSGASHVDVNRIQVLLVYQWDNLSRGVLGMPHTQRLCFSDQTLHKGLIQVCVYKQARTGDASLPRGTENAVDHPIYGQIQIGILQHHRRRLASQLQGGTNQALCCNMSQLTSCARPSCEGNFLHQWMLHNGIALD